MTAIDRLAGIADGLGVKAPVRAATTANVTLSGEQTIDGVALVENDRVLVKDQSTAVENGIYVVSTSTWARAKDFNGTRDVVQGTAVLIAGGTVNANRIYFLSTASPVIGTSSLTFSVLEVPVVPDDDSVTTAKLQDNSVTYAKMQNVSATSRIIGRKTAGAGDPEELTISEALDFVGSAAQGDILYRNASGWTRLAAGTSGYYLKTQGAGADPAWAAALTSVASTDITDSGAAGRSHLQLAKSYQTRDGLSFGSYDFQRCYVNPGLLSSAAGTSLISLDYELTCDIRVVGVTTGSPVLGSSPYIGGWLESPSFGSYPADGTGLHFYYIQKDSAPNAGALAFVASTAVFQGDVIAALPSGWSYFAPAQHCVVWHTGRGTNWQGFPDFFNPPRTPEVILTGSGESSNYRVLNAGDSAGAWVTLSLASWLADSARDPVLFGRVDLAVGATSGGAWIRPNGIGSGGYPIGYCLSDAGAANIAYSGDIWVKTDSSRVIQYMTTGDVTLSLYLKGWKFSEPR